VLIQQVIHSFSHRLRGYLYAAPPKKASLLVTLDDGKKCIQRLDIKVRFIAMPFQVTLHPENLPEVLATNERRLGNK
jgi:hypothetical protein